MAYSNGARGSGDGTLAHLEARLFGRLDPRSGSSQPGHEVVEVGGSTRSDRRGACRRGAFEPVVRDEADDRGKGPRIEQRGESGFSFRDRARERQQDVVADRLERTVGVGLGLAPGVVDVERGAVVDQPQPSVPAQQVGVARRSDRRSS